MKCGWAHRGGVPCAASDLAFVHQSNSYRHLIELIFDGSEEGSHNGEWQVNANESSADGPVLL